MKSERQRIENQGVPVNEWERKEEITKSEKQETKRAVDEVEIKAIENNEKQKAKHELKQVQHVQV